MPKATRSRQHKEDDAINEASKSALLDPEKDLEGAAKKKWHAKRVKEDKAAAEGRVEQNYHYELEGQKLLKKVRKVNGSMYCYYVSNIRKEPSSLDAKDVKLHAKGDALLKALSKRK